MSFKVVTLQHAFFLESALDLARLSLDQKESPTSNSRRACVLGSVLCAVSFLECFINGLFDYAAEPVRRTTFHRALASVWDDVDREQTLTKYQLALALCGQPPFPVHCDPYQSAAILIKFRNAISHPKEIIAQTKSQQRLENKLRGKYVFTASRCGDGHDEFFPHRCLSPDGAAWGVETAARFALDFHGRLPTTAYWLPETGRMEAVLRETKVLRKG